MIKNLNYKLKILNRQSDVYIELNDQDRLDLISYRIYEDPQYYWLILYANGYNLEFDIEPGTLLRIPYPLNSALNDIGMNQ